MPSINLRRGMPDFHEFSFLIFWTKLRKSIRFERKNLIQKATFHYRLNSHSFSIMKRESNPVEYSNGCFTWLFVNRILLPFHHIHLFWIIGTGSDFNKISLFQQVSQSRSGGSIRGLPDLCCFFCPYFFMFRKMHH